MKLTNKIFFNKYKWKRFRMNCIFTTTEIKNCKKNKMKLIQDIFTNIINLPF